MSRLKIECDEQFLHHLEKGDEQPIGHKLSVEMWETESPYQRRRGSQ